MEEEIDESLCTEYQLEATELEVRDLQYNMTYYFELIAHNAEGNSTPANMSLTIGETFYKKYLNIQNK